MNHRTKCNLTVCRMYFLWLELYLIRRGCLPCTREKILADVSQQKERDVVSSGLDGTINLVYTFHPSMTLLKNKAVSELCFKRGLAEAQLLGGSWAWRAGVLWRGWQRCCCRLALMVIGLGRCLQQLPLMGCCARQGPDLETPSAPQRMYGPESIEK